MDLIDARELARAAAKDYYPDATEVETISSSAYELDGICMDNDPEWREVRIWHDPDANTFALENVPRASVADVLARDVEIDEYLKRAMVRQMMALHISEDQEGLTAMYATLASSLAQSTRLVAEERGYDVDKIREAVDKIFLHHPEFQ